MTRWGWAGAVAICASPQVLVMLLLMFSIWAGTAEIIAAIDAVSYHGEVPALMLAGFNAPFAAWMFANFLNLGADLRELRTPQRRQLLIGALGFFLALMVVAPAALALSWHLVLRDVVVVVLGTVAGMTGAALWTVRARGRAADSGWVPNRSRELRVALGPPYAPTTWRARLLQFALLFAVLFGPALLVIAFGRSLSSGSFAAWMHAAEFLGVAVAIALCWIWPLSRTVALFNPLRGASTELALLPGLGNDRPGLGRLFLIAVWPPAVALVLLFVIAIGAAWLERPPSATYVKLAVEFSLVPLGTLPLFLGEIAQPRARGGRLWLLILMLSPVYSVNSMIWNGSWQAFAALPQLRWGGIAGVLMILIFIIGMSLLLLQKIRQRPHPFVDVSA
jgi:hypothetical protein